MLIVWQDSLQFLCIPVMHSCEDLTETTGLLIAIIEQIESQQGELNAQQIDFLKRCLEE